MVAMRTLAPAFFAAALLISASAFADEPPPPAPAPALAAPPPAAAAPAYPAPPPYAGPGYSVPYATYTASRGGAPYPLWMAVPPVTERRSNGMRIAGISLFVAGGVISAVGGVIFGAVATTGCQEVLVSAEDAGPSPAATHERIGSARQALNGCDTSPELGLGIIGAGALTAVVGIPLFVMGSKQVPARPAIGKLVPAVSLGAGNGSLRWTF